MTWGKSLTKNLLFIPQVVFFMTAIVLLSALNLSGHAVEIKRPVILLAACLLALFSFKNNESFSVIAKIILLYIISMLFGQLSGRFVHIGSFSLHLSLIALLPLTVSFICSLVRSQDRPFDSSDLFKSWVVVFAAIILHMLFLFILLKNIYGYGYDHNLPVLANMSLYFLVFIFIWGQLDKKGFRRIAALIFIAFFILIIARGA